MLKHRQFLVRKMQSRIDVTLSGQGFPMYLFAFTHTQDISLEGERPMFYSMFPIGPSPLRLSSSYS